MLPAVGAAWLAAAAIVGSTPQFHDLTTLARVEQLAVPSGPRLVRFSADGARVVVVAANQRATLVDTKALRGAAAVVSSGPGRCGRPQGLPFRLR